MVYLGSKNKISKYIVPIIQSYINECTEGYLEPFVGGANIIDKISHSNRIGYDIHEYLIELLNYAKDNSDKIPSNISYEEYCNVRDNKCSYPKWYVGLVGFCCTFSAKWFQGYAKANDTRNRQNEMIRNLIKQSHSLKDITFKCVDYKDIKDIKNYVIYCDKPYESITTYNGCGKFDHDLFWNWARKMSVNNIVLVSEYNAPNDFVCIWEKEVTTNINHCKNEKNKNDRIERLYIYETNYKNNYKRMG